MAYPSALEPDSIFAKDFRVVRGLRVGGMGSVYVVTQISTGKQRALKLLASQLVNNAEMRERFVREAQAAAEIDSDHVVEIVTAGVDEESQTPYIAMELLRGEELADAVDRRGAFPLGEVREVLAQIGHALAQAHAQRIVHRDLKPENIFLALPRGRGTTFTAKLLDFGVAKFLALGASEMGTAPVGSPLFMAPEQTDAFGNICPATDVWALGLLAFYLLTGRSYWLGAERASVPALLREVCLDPLVSASFRADQLAVSELIPEGFDDWFAHCVERDTDGRYVEAGEAVRAFLEAVPEGLPIEPSSLGHVFAGPADDSQDTPFSARGSDALPLALHPTSLPPPPDSHAPDLEALPEYASIEDPYESFPSSDSDFQAAWGAPSFDVDAPSSEDSNGDFTKEGPSGPTPDSVAGLAMDFGFGSESASDLGPSATDLGAPSEGIEAAADLHAAEPGRKSPTSPSEKRPKLKRSMQVVAAGVALGTLLGGVAGWRTRSASSVAARQSAQAPKEAPSSVPPRKPCPAGMILEPGRSSPTELLPFCIDRTEVTVLAFARCVEAGSCDHVTSGTDYPPARDRLKDAYASLCNSRGHAPGKTSPLDLVQVRGGEVTASDLSAGVSNSDPINCIDWWSATTYCQWMKGRLPSEEEWRFAANAIPPKPVGRRTDPSEPEEPTANLCGGECFDWGLGHGQLLRAQSEQWDGFAGTSPVGAFARFDVPGVPADLDGNVAEWTSTQSSSGAEAPLPAGKSYRAVLGKAFMPRPQQGSEADRSLVDPAAKSYLIGFRCVSSTAIELPQSPAEPAESGTPIEYGPPLPPAIAAGGDPVALVVASALPAETAAQPVQVPSAPAESAAPSDDAPLRELVREEMPVPPRE